jgi:hypothetical protein
MGVTDLSNGITIVNNLNGNPTRITISNAGIYNIQFSLQLEKTGGSGNMTADIWLRKNGNNIEGTTGKVVLTGSANASPLISAWNYLIDASSNDYYELMWSTSNVNVKIVADPASPPYPSIPSVILTVTQQSGIMAGTGISPLDTANMLSTYLRKSDTTAMLSPYLRESDTTAMLNPYLRESDTSSLSQRINAKLSISDTSVFQRKQLPAYSFIANGTNAAANGTATYFEDTSGTYTGTITWTAGTNPSGATNHSYRWTRIGKMVYLTISLVYATNALTATQVIVTLPSDAPTPLKPAGLTNASNGLYAVNVQTQQNATAAALNNTGRAILRNNSGNNGFEIIAGFSSSTIVHTFFQVQYTAE